MTCRPYGFHPRGFTIQGTSTFYSATRSFSISLFFIIIFLIITFLFFIFVFSFSLSFFYILSIFFFYLSLFPPLKTTPTNPFTLVRLFLFSEYCSKSIFVVGNKCNAAFLLYPILLQYSEGWRFNFYFLFIFLSLRGFRIANKYFFIRVYIYIDIKYLLKQKLASFK